MNILLTSGVDKRKIYDLVNILTSLNLIAKVAKGYYRWNSLQGFVKCVETIPIFDKLSDEYKYEKSLGSMSYCFLSLLKTYEVITLEATAEHLSKYNDINYKSKIRRLYDICKILTALGLIVQQHDEKRSTLHWQGTQNLEVDIQKIINSEPVEFHKDKSNQKLQQLKADFFNNISKAIENSDLYPYNVEEVLKKRRTSSFDVTIVEKFLSDNNQVVLPKVHIPSIEKHN